jgi:hypothetical protein
MAAQGGSSVLAPTGLTPPEDRAGQPSPNNPTLGQRSHGGRVNPARARRPLSAPGHLNGLVPQRIQRCVIQGSRATGECGSRAFRRVVTGLRRWAAHGAPPTLTPLHRRLTSLRRLPTSRLANGSTTRTPWKPPREGAPAVTLGEVARRRSRSVPHPTTPSRSAWDMAGPALPAGVAGVQSLSPNFSVRTPSRPWPTPLSDWRPRGLVTPRSAQATAQTAVVVRPASGDPEVRDLQRRLGLAGWPSASWADPNGAA